MILIEGGISCGEFEVCLEGRSLSHTNWYVLCLLHTLNYSTLSLTSKPYHTLPLMFPFTTKTLFYSLCVNIKKSPYIHVVTITYSKFLICRFYWFKFPIWISKGWDPIVNMRNWNTFHQLHSYNKWCIFQKLSCCLTQKSNCTLFPWIAPYWEFLSHTSLI